MYEGICGSVAEMLQQGVKMLQQMCIFGIKPDFMGVWGVDVVNYIWRKLPKLNFAKCAARLATG